MMTTCPACNELVADDAKVCRHCFHVLDPEGWQHDPGRLGADERGAGRSLEDPPVGPLHVMDSGVGGRQKNRKGRKT